MNAVLSFRAPVPAFDGVAADDARFVRIARACLLPALVFGLLLPWAPRQQLERLRVALPPPAAQLLPDPEPARALPRAAAPPALTQAAAPPSPRSVVPEARRPQPQRPAGEHDAQRPRASGVGLLALQQQVAEIHGAPLAVQLQAASPSGRGVGSGKGAGVGAGQEPGLPARALVTATAGLGSGGIDTAGFSRDAGGAGLAGRATTLVAGVAGGAGGGGPGGGGVGIAGGRGSAAAGAAAPAGARGNGSDAARARRSIEDIKLVFDRNKGAIYALYNRALRDEPALQGKVVLELKIAPSGEVVDCRIVASELHAAELERRLVARVRQFDFGAKAVETMVVAWPVDFLPS